MAAAALAPGVINASHLKGCAGDLETVSTNLEVLHVARLDTLTQSNPPPKGYTGTDSATSDAALTKALGAIMGALTTPSPEMTHHFTMGRATLMSFKVFPVQGGGTQVNWKKVQTWTEARDNTPGKGSGTHSEVLVMKALAQPIKATSNDVAVMDAMSCSLANMNSVTQKSAVNGYCVVVTMINASQPCDMACAKYFSLAQAAWADELAAIKAGCDAYNKHQSAIGSAAGKSKTKSKGGTLAPPALPDRAWIDVGAALQSLDVHIEWAKSDNKDGAKKGS